MAGTDFSILLMLLTESLKQPSVKICYTAFLKGNGDFVVSDDLEKAIQLLTGRTCT